MNELPENVKPNIYDRDNPLSYRPPEVAKDYLYFHGDLETKNLPASTRVRLLKFGATAVAFVGLFGVAGKAASWINGGEVPRGPVAQIEDGPKR